MIRRRFVTGAVALMVLAGACGLGNREAQADRITNAGKKLMASDSVRALVTADVKVLPVERQLVQVEPPRIAPGHLGGIETLINPRANTAAVALGKIAADGAIRFVGSEMFERIAPKTVDSGGAALAGIVNVPSNLTAIYTAATGEVPGQAFRDEVTGASAVVPTTTSSSTIPTTTTSTTAPPRVLRRTVQIVREWAAFDFAEIADRDRTKHGGSFAINPVALLRLTTGVLTGSIERRGSSYEANVSRDKAERTMSEDEREVLDKMFTANAITRRVFPAKFTFAANGELASYEVKLRQQLSSKDRADLTITFVLDPADGPVTVTKPAKRGTVHVSTLGQLVTTVSGL